MLRKFAAGLGFSILIAGGLPAQKPLAFEVATIRPSGRLDNAAMMSGKVRVGTKIDASQVNIGFTPFISLITTAYSVKPWQVNGPEWIKTAMFDIQARLPEGATPEQVPEMMQTLLAERFGMTMHRSEKDAAVYALVVAKGGPKLKEAPDPALAPATEPGMPAATAKDSSFMTVPTAQGEMKISGNPLKGLEVSGSWLGKIRLTLVDGQMRMESSRTNMKTVADMLSNGMVDRPVIDMTGLSGDYEMTIDLSMDDMMNAARANGLGAKLGAMAAGADTGKASDPSGSSIFTSLQKLGLRLDPRNTPVDLIVIDHVEKTPTEN